MAHAHIDAQIFILTKEEEEMFEFCHDADTS